jgi:hypothetical protein
VRWFGLGGTTAKFWLSSSESSRLFELEAGLVAGTSRLLEVVISLSRSLAQLMSAYFQHNIREKLTHGSRPAIDSRLSAVSSTSGHLVYPSLGQSVVPIFWRPTNIEGGRRPKKTQESVRTKITSASKDDETRSARTMILGEVRSGYFFLRLITLSQCCHDPGLTGSDPDLPSGDLTLLTTVKKVKGVVGKFHTVYGKSCNVKSDYPNLIIRRPLKSNDLYVLHYGAVPSESCDL